MRTSEGRALARAALAGNPSDGFGGAVLATVVPGLEAVVRAQDHHRVVVGDRTWAAPAAVAGPHGGDGALMAATVERVVRWCRDHGRAVPTAGVALDWSTSIPRSVGLAGSSALVLATLRALAGRWHLDLEVDGNVDGNVDGKVDGKVVTAARLALEVERDLLGLAAGPQDRLTQAAGRTVLMDFGGPAWSVEPVDPPEPVRAFVAWSTHASVPSQVVHAPLQARRDEPAVRDAMARLAGLAGTAAVALRAGDVDLLGTAMDRSYETRASILALDPAHVALVEGARACGAPANYTGSGGAVVGLATDPSVLDAVRAWVARAGLGLATFELGPDRDRR